MYVCMYVYIYILNFKLSLAKLVSHHVLLGLGAFSFYFVFLYDFPFTKSFINWEINRLDSHEAKRQDTKSSVSYTLSKLTHAHSHTHTYAYMYIFVIILLFFLYIIISEAPRITVAPTDQKVTENGIVSFFCRASGNPKPEVYWRRGGKRITTSNNRYAVVNVPQQGGGSPSSSSSSASGASAPSSSSSGPTSGTGGGDGSVLRIEMAKPRKDDAVFECVAESGYGDPAVATAKLDVYPEGQGMD